MRRLSGDIGQSLAQQMIRHDCPQASRAAPCPPAQWYNADRTMFPPDTDAYHCALDGERVFALILVVVAYECDRGSALEEY